MPVMNPVEKLMSWWRRPVDPDALAADAESRRSKAQRDTIRSSQSAAGTGTSGSLIDVPTPNMLDPGRKDIHSSR
jgi:hypothetical protein